MTEYNTEFIFKCNIKRDGIERESIGVIIKKDDEIKLNTKKIIAPYDGILWSEVDNIERKYLVECDLSIMFNGVEVKKI